MENITQKIAIDIGYGDTKVMANGKTFKFPSAITQIRQSQVQNSEQDPQTYSFNDVFYLVGDDAINSAIATRGYGFLKKYSPLLIYKAIEEVCFYYDKPIEIATGLSLVNQSEAKDFISKISSFTINGVSLKPKIFLFAQGQGIYNDMNGCKDGLVCVVDIGYNTLDFLVFGNGKPNNSLCFANKKGANLAIVDLQKILMREFKVDFSEQEAKRVFLNKKIKIAGEEVDFSDAINSSMQHYADEIVNEIINKNGDIIAKADCVIIGGGGAYFLQKEYLQELQRANYIFVKDSEFSNVRGYFNGAFNK